MRMSYGVVWRQGTSDLARGKLELLPRAMRLEGMTGSEPTSREIPYDVLSEIRVGRKPEERLDGRLCLVLASRSGEPPLAIASVAQTGVVGELAERLSALQADARAHRPIAVVLPIRHGSREAARALLAEGPPFDPVALGLDRHHVLLTESEAIFIFESTLGSSALESLLGDAHLLESAAVWHEHLAGPPRIAEDVYSWTRPSPEIDRSLLPPGLRNGDTRDQ
jgi:hypothetical protein